MSRESYLGTEKHVSKKRKRIPADLQGFSLEQSLNTFYGKIEMFVNKSIFLQEILHSTLLNQSLCSCIFAVITLIGIR
ncbi:Potassium transporter [Trichinella spiralis]|uniref:Potassium transporter n=1 Tax=Trichinella spiralis TaxID=6334 RepID=A0ABR3L104_TRISP